MVCLCFFTLYMAFFFSLLWYQVIVRWFCISSRQVDLGDHPLLIVIFVITMKMFLTRERERERESIQQPGRKFSYSEYFL